MDRPVSDQGMSNNYLTQVREGMDVYDAKDQRIGKVDEVYFGEVSPDAADAGLGPQGVSQGDNTRDRGGFVPFAFGGSTSPLSDWDDIDEVFRNRMLREGYIKIDPSGLFTRHRYALPDQIESISEDAVHLRVTADDLIRPR